MASKMLDVLEANGAVHAMVVFGHDGLDELDDHDHLDRARSSVDAEGGRVRTEHVLDPRTFGLELSEPSALTAATRSSTPSESALCSVARADHNATSWCSTPRPHSWSPVRPLQWKTAWNSPRRTIDSGAATCALDALIESSNSAPR